MPRDDDDRPTDRRKQPNSLRWVTGAVVALGLLAPLGCGSGAKPTGGGAGPGQAAKKTYTREEFRKLVEGKTADEVIQAVGKPKETSQSGEDQNWNYEDVTADPVTGKMDGRARVSLERGKVVAVSFR